MAAASQGDDDYSEEEAKRRFEAALRAALATPHTPLKDKPKVRPKHEPLPPEMHDKFDHMDCRPGTAPAAAGRPTEPASSRGGAPSASSSRRGARGRA